MQHDTSTLSPDGQWRWDGTQWVPAASAAPAPTPTLSPDGRSRWDGTKWVPVAPPAPQTHTHTYPSPAQAGAPSCQVCGAQPAAEISMRQHIGAILFWFNRRYTATCCRDCGIAFFRQKQNLTLLTGWWGLGSFVIFNWITIIYNGVQRGTAARLAAPVRPAGAVPLDPGRPVFLRPGMFLACIAALIVLAVILIDIWPS